MNDAALLAAPPMPWQAAAKEIAQSICPASVEDVVRRACAQWAGMCDAVRGLERDTLRAELTHANAESQRLRDALQRIVNHPYAHRSATTDIAAEALAFIAPSGAPRTDPPAP